MNSYSSRVGNEKVFADVGVPTWMVEALGRNPPYKSWAPGDNYMPKFGSRTEDSVVFPTWERPPVDDLNLVVHFYFSVRVGSSPCTPCGGSGYGPEAKRLRDTLFTWGEDRWSNKLTMDDLQVLVDNNRISGPATKALLRRVNQDNRPGVLYGYRLDSLSADALIQGRCKRLGHDFFCGVCKGDGSFPTGDPPTPSLTLWQLQPRLGLSRGYFVERVTEKDLPDILSYLREGRDLFLANFKGVDDPVVG